MNSYMLLFICAPGSLSPGTYSTIFSSFSLFFVMFACAFIIHNCVPALLYVRFRDLNYSN